MSHPEIRVQHDAINAIIAAAQEILIKRAQPLAHETARYILGNPVQRGHRFQGKADSNPVIADSR
jgi:hypothetical protein